MAGPAEIVTEKHNAAMSLANSAGQAANSFRTALNNTLYSPPQISLNWSTVAPAKTPDLPKAPNIPQDRFQMPLGKPSNLSATVPSPSMPTSRPTKPSISFPSAPTFRFGTAPTLPEVRDVSVPSAPSITLPTMPSLMALSTINFAGVNDHAGWLSKLQNIPDLALIEPTAFSYSMGPGYSSALLAQLKSTLERRLRGGTGLAKDVEQKIWDRARDREEAIARGAERDAVKASESLGFSLPSGVLMAKLDDIRRDYHEKLSSLSRDVAIKQAELEQENLRDAVQSATQLETSLADLAYKLEALAFEAAKTAAQQAVAVYNAGLEKYKALVGAYQTYASVYGTLIDAEKAKVDAYRAQLAGEETKANINKTLVEQYKAQIEGSLAQVRIFTAQVSAAQTQMELERTRIMAGGEHIKAYVATVNAEVARAEVYKAQISGEMAKTEAYGSEVRAYSAEVSAMAEHFRAEVSRFNALATSKTLEWEGWKAQVNAEAARMNASYQSANIAVEGYRAAARASEAGATMAARQWEASVGQYTAGRELAFRVAKANQDATIHAYDVRIDAAKVQLATAAQQAASAWSAVSAHASISGSDTTTRQL